MAYYTHSLSTFIIPESVCEEYRSIEQEVLWRVSDSLFCRLYVTVKCKMRTLVSGSISLSGHLAAEMLLRVATEQNFIWVFISPG